MSLRAMSFDAIENLHRLDHKSGETIREMAGGAMTPIVPEASETQLF